MSFLNYINPTSKYFLNTKEDAQSKRDFETNLNRVGYNATDIATYRNNAANWSWNTLETNGILFDGLTENKRQKIELYREMSLYPLIRKGLSIITDEVISPNTKGEVLHFDLQPVPLTKIHTSEFEDLREQFEHVVNCVIHSDRIWYLFYQWLVDSEMIWEKVPSGDGKELVGINVLPAFNTIPVYYQGRRLGFMQDPNLFAGNLDKGNTTPKVFNKEQIAYSQYAFCGEAPINNIYGHLEPVIRHLNQLRAIEDALTVYRVTRAPEKRIFKIFVGKTAPAQVGAKVKKLKEEYRKELNIDPKTGIINTNNRVQSYTEDFYFPVFNNSEGSSLESFKGSNEFNGQIEDLKFLQRQVMDGMLIPLGRYDETTVTNYSSAPETAMSEITFQKMAHRLGKQFCNDLIRDVFITQLKLLKYDEKYLDPTIYNIDFNNAQDFQRIREISLAEKIGGIIGSFAQYMPTLANSKPDSEDQRPLFSREYLYKKLLSMSTADIKDNEDTIQTEMKALTDKASEKTTEGGAKPEEADNDEF